VVLPSQHAAAEPQFHSDWKPAVEKVLQDAKSAQTSAKDDHYELHVYESVPLRDGRHANNPWLLELPDPISKVTWGNVAAVVAGAGKKTELVGWRRCTPQGPIYNGMIDRGPMMIAR